MADEIVAPGVERSVFESCGETRFYGTADALTEAGLIAPGCPLPGSQPGKRGVRWQDAQGRRHVLAKCRDAALCLTVYPTAQEKATARRALETKARLEAIKKEMAPLCIDEEVWRTRVGEMVAAGVFAAVHVAFRLNAPGERNERWEGPYSYDLATRQRLGALYLEMRDLLRTAKVTRDDTRIQALKRERATLEDKGLQTFLARLAR